MPRPRILGAFLALVIGLAGGAACERPAPRTRLVLWHTFGPEETRALNEALGELAERDRAVAVEATLVPFGRARSRLSHVLGAASPDCPDLARADVTWVPQLAAKGLIAPVPDAALAEGFLPEALELARWNGQLWGLPQAVDGLALLYDRRQVPGGAAGLAWPPRTLAELEAAARALARPGRAGLSLRSDGYWFVAWLRASGGDVLDPGAGRLGVDEPGAREALERYVALAGSGAATALVTSADEAAIEADLFAQGKVAVVVGGPWTVAALQAAARRRGATLDLAVAPFPSADDGRPAAPRGGQLWIVPRCAAHPAEAWRLATALTDPRLQARWSHQLGLVPTRAAALAQASPLGREFAAALAHTRPLPRDPLTPLIFDDLTPAVQAALAGDATAEEALAGVARAWRRLLR